MADSRTLTRRRILSLAALPFYAPLLRVPSGPREVRVAGRVVDAASGAPIADAIVTSADRIVRTDSRGAFLVDVREDDRLRIRAHGYLRAEAPAARKAADAVLKLTPFRPKALYLSVYGIGDRRLRGAALGLVESTELNALVIDLKGDRGLVPYRSDCAADVGAQRVITIPDLAALAADLRQRGVYSIARIVAFKDALLAAARPTLAIRRLDGSIFRDNEGLAWTNPHRREVWDYNIGIAVEAARAGFDEIQFDYVRLPDASGLAYDLVSTEQTRTAAIGGFLDEARRRLASFNVFLAADVFGYVCWNRTDTSIGQKLEHLGGVVDYISPMLYPSSFRHGIPGYRTPVEHPYQIVRLSLERARQRTQLPAVRFRPWLQAFRDYAFGGRAFDADEIRAQIDAAEHFGADGWMLWNPQNRYSSSGLTAAMPVMGRD